MNPPNPLDPSLSPLYRAADEASNKATEGIDAARDKLKDIGHLAQEKMEAVGHKASEAMHSARDTMESAGTSLLQWARENPATALATFFASGFVIGCALTMQRHEKTFGERFHDDPLPALLDTLKAALHPIRDRVHEAAESARSMAGDVVDRVTHANNGNSLSSRMRSLWN